MNLTKRYHQELASKGYKSDAAQRAAIEKLAALAESLSEYHIDRQKFKAKFVRPTIPQGVYFWGGVGRGKTFIMDLFYDEVAVPKTRLHFHRFMQMIHRKLQDHQSKKNPIDRVIKEFASETLLLCLDEFFVSDIGDAMILANILAACYREGIVVVTTSNVYPDGLYQNGLQRSRFLPAIEGIKQHLDIVQLDAGTDYRLITLTSSPLYFTPLDQSAELALKGMFEKLAPDLEEVEESCDLAINGRNIRCIRSCEDILWVSFEQLCAGPRSVADYIELSHLYHAVLISGVRVMTADTEDLARRFVNMVDEFYDRGVKLIISAEAELDQLYQGVRLRFEFERTMSRLLEMQSDVYLASAHRPE